MYDVIAIGELLIDFTSSGSNHNGYPILSAHPGGGVANYLSAVSKFGKKSTLIAKVGNDAFGHLLTKTIKDVGIDASNICITDDVFTTLAFVTHDQNGDRSFSFARKPGADTCLSIEDVDISLLDNTKVLHFSTVGMTSNPSRSTHKTVIAAAKEKGVLLSFDPNLREPLWNNLADCKEQILWGLSMADIVKISDNEVEFLFGMTPEQGAKHILQNFPVKLLYITLGKNGALFSNKNAQGVVPAPTLTQKVIDTTGAGDIFGGSAMFKFLEYNTAPEDLDYQQMENICKFACKAASLSTTKLGGLTSVPELDEI